MLAAFSFFRLPSGMAAITWDNVVAIAAELSTLGVDAQTIILDHVNVAFKVSLFGGEDHPKVKLMRILLAAHYGQLTKDGAHGPAGQVVAQSRGGLSRAYASNSPMGTDPLWDKTVWGQQLRTMINTSAARVPIVI